MPSALRKNANYRIRVYGRRAAFKTTIPSKLDINARYNELFYPDKDDLQARTKMTEEIIKIYDILCVETVHTDSIPKIIKKVVDEFRVLHKNWNRAQSKGILKADYFKFDELIQVSH